MLPPPLPPEHQPHRRSTSAGNLSACDMSFELEAAQSRTQLPCKPEKELVQDQRAIKEEEAKEADDSYDDLSFVDIDGLMDVDLDEQSSSPTVEQHVPSTAQESNKVTP